MTNPIKSVLGWGRSLYNWVLNWANTRYGTPALGVLSFAESSFFPIPPDVLLIALGAERPKRSYYYALICSIASVLGGMLGYMIGSFLWYTATEDGSMTYSGLAQAFFHYIPGVTPEKFEHVKELFDEWNFWVVFTAGFTPIPYKLITISAGVADINFLVFVAASAVGRSARFFLVGTLFYFYGAPIKLWIDRYFEILSVAFLVLLFGGFMLIKYVM